MRKHILSSALALTLALSAYLAFGSLQAQADQLCHDPYGIAKAVYSTGIACRGGSVNNVPASTITPAPTQTGQFPYSADGSTFTLLNVGTSGQLLKSTGAVPQWTTVPLAPTPAATGQILSSTNGTSFSLLNIGTAGQVLTVVSGVPAWASSKYVIAGTAPASTYHCVTSPAAGYTAAGTPQAVVFSGAAVFAGFYTLALNDNGPTGLTIPAITAKVTTGFTFTATNFASDTYSFIACGE
jgi:hypothetical protein